jgi:ATP-dependent Clp protease adaptor protein ClpS
MAQQQSTAVTDHESQGGVAAPPQPRELPRRSPREAPPKADRLPPWKIILHNDDINDMIYVIQTIKELTGMNTVMATRRMLEAHTRGLALLLVTHRERAELLVEQFVCKKLIVTTEPD